MSRGRPRKAQRTPERVRYHYEVEREIADRLRAASAEERPQMYCDAYDELFARVADHPQLTGHESRASQAHARDQWRFLRHFTKPGDTLVEVGPGDCALTVLAAGTAHCVIAVDVSSTILGLSGLPGNVRCVVASCSELPLPDSSVQIVYCDQLLEHLHPDDARAHLRSTLRVLDEGGVYVCITPNAAAGPHDVSRGFTREATGLHLKEYTLGELTGLLADVGFSRVRQYVGTRGLYSRVPLRMMLTLESGFLRLPDAWRRWLIDTPMSLPFVHMRLVASK